MIIYLLFPANDLHISISKYIAEICEQYEVDYVNFLENAEKIIDYNTDCSDETDHLNASGSKKSNKSFR